MFGVNTDEIKQLESDLKTFNSRAFPFATKSTINSAAFATQKIAKQNITGSLTLRNRFTVQSIQVDQSRTLQVNNQTAIVGSIADYMEQQEFGGDKTSVGGKNVSITTGYAAGQEGQEPRTKLAKKPNKMMNIRLSKKNRKGKTRKQRNLIAVRVAAKSSNKFTFLDMGRIKGIFRVLGKGKRIRIKMVQDMTRKSVSVPKKPWLLPAVDEAETMIPDFYEKALRFQIKRNGLFK